MDNIVQVNTDLYINIAEAVKIEAHGKSFRISIRNNQGTLTDIIAIRKLQVITS